MKRQGPKCGYDVGAKRQYRRDVWATFRRFCSPRCVDAHAFLMPSMEGDEIEVAMRNGFRQQHLHVVDRNPAIVATLKRRFPLIHTYGVEVQKAIRRIASDGFRLAVANFDLCSPLNDGYCEVVESVAMADVWTPRRMLAFTVLKGREQRGELQLNRAVTQSFLKSDGDRLDLILALLGIYCSPRPPNMVVGVVRRGQYRTSVVPMIWGAYYIGTLRPEHYVQVEDSNRKPEDILKEWGKRVVPLLERADG